MWIGITSDYKENTVLSMVNDSYTFWKYEVMNMITVNFDIMVWSKYLFYMHWTLLNICGDIIII